jgi:VIT1/CCC1 family predicted Fe2+/Mn2+ transporter
VFGSLITNGQWSWKFLIFATALCAAVPIIAYIYGSLDLLFAAILAILAIVTLILVTTGKTEEWVETDRL